MWNAVYIQHADGTTAWYGHMKSGSLTTKTVGQAVALGEFLGTVGSSGSSTGPHLHFEVHNASNQVIDPWAGTCNAITSMRASQRSYYDPYINRVMTESAKPSFPACPASEITNEKTSFQPGEQIVMAVYLRDQQNGGKVDWKVYKPNSTVDNTWTLTFDTYYSSSYWYYTSTIPANAMHGTWTLEVKMNGQTATTTYTVGVASGVNNKSNEPVFSAYYLSDEKIIKVELSPKNTLQQVEVYNLLGEQVLSSAKQKIDVQSLSKGIYIITSTDAENTRYAQKISIY